MTIIIGTNNISRYIKLEDLYIPYEILTMLMRISSNEMDKSEYIGLIRHNNKRYIKLDDEVPIIELFRGKATGSTSLIPEIEKSQFDKAILNFHTHPSGKGKITTEEASIDDCEAFSGMKRSIGARFHAVITTNKITLYDFSDIKGSQTRECDEKSNIYECLEKLGVKKYTLDGTEDILLVA